MYKYIIITLLVLASQKYTYGDFIAAYSKESVRLECHAPIPITWHYSPTTYEINELALDFDSIKWYYEPLESNIYELLLSNITYNNSGTYACVDNWSQKVFRKVVLTVLDENDDYSNNVFTGGFNLTLSCGDHESSNDIKYWLHRSPDKLTKFEYLTYGNSVLPQYENMGYELTKTNSLLMKNAKPGIYVCIHNRNYDIFDSTKYGYNVHKLTG